MLAAQLKLVRAPMQCGRVSVCVREYCLPYPGGEDLRRWYFWFDSEETGRQL